MKITTALLAGTVIPTLVLLVQPAHAESASGIVVAQAQPEKDKPKPAPAKPAKPAPPAAKPRLRRQLPHALRLRHQLPHALRLRRQLPHALRLRRQLPHALRLRHQLPHALRLRHQLPHALRLRHQLPHALRLRRQLPHALRLRHQLPHALRLRRQLPHALRLRHRPPQLPRLLRRPPQLPRRQHDRSSSQASRFRWQSQPWHRHQRRFAVRGGRPAAGVAAPAAAVAPTATPANVRRMDDFRSQRREVREGDRTIIREPGRTIIKQGNVTVIRRDESDRFRYGARNMIAERRGNELRTIAVRPDGSRIINVTDDTGRLVRRVRRDQFGREFVMFDNSRSGTGVGTALGIGIAAGLAAGLGVAYLANVPPPVITIPEDQYIVDTRYAPPAMLYDTLAAPPIDAIERPYTLDEIRYTPALRQRMRSVDINTLTFDSGSFELRPDQYGQLEAIANAIRQVTEANPNEVFLIEGHTDAVGTEEDNISLSDRRAEAVAVALTEQFQVPPENLTTQGYGEQQLKVPVQGPNEQNRRVTVRRITPLLAGK